MVLPSKVSFSGPHFLTVDVCKNIFIAPSFHGLNYCIWYSRLVLRIFFLVSNAELMFLETSALTGENVEEAFVQCARKILNKIESGKLSFIFIFFFILSEN